MADIFDEIEVSEPDKKDIFDEIEDAQARTPIVAPSAVSTTRGLIGSAERGIQRGVMIPEVMALPGLVQKATPTVGQERRAFERAMTDPAYFAASTIPDVSPLAVESRFGPASQLDRMMFKPKAALTETARDVAEGQKKISEIPKSEAQVRMAKADTQADKWGAWLKDPVELTTSIVLESLPPSLVGAGVGAAGGPAGMAAGVGMASGLTEFSSTFLDEAVRQGYNVQDPASLEKFLNDSKAYNTAIDKGITRAGIVGGVDAITGGTAGRFLKPALAQALKQRVIATGKELGVQAAGGAGGEAAAQIASGQPLDPFDIAMEAVAEIGSGPAEIAGNLRREQPAATIDEAAINSGLEQATPFPETIGAAKATTLAPTMDTARAIVKMSPDEFFQQASAFNSINLPIGENATESEYQELKALGKQAEARKDEALKLAQANPTEENLNALSKLAVMPQFYNEAIAAFEQKRKPKEAPIEKSTTEEVLTQPATEAPSFAAKYNPETLMQRPAWVEPGSMLDKVLGELREKNDPNSGRDIAPIWKTLTPKQRQDLAARGWVTVNDRNPNAVVLKIAQDVGPARSYYGMQRKQALKSQEAALAETAVEIPLGLERPQVQNPSLSRMSEANFDAEFMSAKKVINEAEKAFDNVESPSELTPQQRRDIASAQDRWGAARLERERRNYSDIHTEDVLRKMIDLADSGHDFPLFQVLADVLKKRGNVRPEDAVGVYRMLPDRVLNNPDFIEATAGKLGKLKQWLERAQQEVQADVRDWTSATDEDQIVEFHAGIPLPKFANRKMSNLDKATTSHSSKVQKSFDEARRVQNEIRKQVGSERRQNAISVWREAAGDIPTLQAWAAAAKGKLFKRAAQDAQTLTAKEIAVANKVISAFSVLESRGNRFDVLRGHRDNYVPHVWDVAKPGFGWGSTRLKERFRFSKARTFNNFFEGDQAGFKPKTLAIGKLLPAYIHEMNQTIADRQFVQDIAKGTMEDGSPMSVPTGNVTAVDNPSGKAILVQPGTKKVADTSDYRVMSDQPALSNWTWKGNDTAGEPAFMKADLALHPDVFRRVNSMLGKSAIRTWYHDPVTGNARIPRAIVRGLDTAQAAMKREMFGLLAPFHQVQEGTHAIGHLVNPFFGTPKIDLRNPNQLDAARHGLMLLPDKATTTSYMEGVGASRSLLSRGIRKATPVGRAIADVIDGYQDYLFHQYIPGLKLKTYEALLSRNTKLYSKELASGEVTVADVKLVSAEQANAAYGHLNYALLDRNPTIQHLIQMAALAPDFLEARVRFTGQGIKGITSKTGHEQFKAIAILAGAQAGASIILSSLLGVPWDPEHPFEVVYKGRRYAMRSVPEDIFGLLKDTRRFIYARVNPLTVKGAVQLATGLNYRGEKTTSMETMGELLAGYIPITARSIPGVRNLTETGRNNSITPLEQLAGSLGLRVSNYSPISETYKLAAEWMDSQKIKRDTGSYPVSKYQQLRYALEDGDMVRAREEYLKLKETMPRDKIYDGFKQSMSHPFTGNQDNDSKFSKSLKGYDRALYDLAVKKRKEIIGRFNGLPKQ